MANKFDQRNGSLKAHFNRAQKEVRVFKPLLNRPETTEPPKHKQLPNPLQVCNDQLSIESKSSYSPKARDTIPHLQINGFAPKWPERAAIKIQQTTALTNRIESEYGDSFSPWLN